MLIKFSVSNAYSFNEETEFRMTAGRTTSRLGSHVIKGKSRNDPRILKSSILCGANASGKSNLIKAMSFAQKLIIEGTKTDSLIQVNPFKLDSSSENKPSGFKFEFMCEDTIYAYGFLLNSNFILEEWLIEIKKTTEKELFHRRTLKDGKVKVSFNAKWIKKKDLQFLGFVRQGTRPNQLFLREAVTRNVKYFSAPYNWFKDCLTILFPDSHIRGEKLVYAVKTDKDFGDNLQKFLIAFGTGIDGLIFKESDLEKSNIELPVRIVKDIAMKLKEKNSEVVVRGSNKEYYIITMGHGNRLMIQRVVTQHRVKNSKENKYFELYEESDGTNRLIDLFPALFESRNKERVFIIDEIDRSLHTNLTYKIFDLFFMFSKDVKNQLIATTHDTGLLTLNLFRRDELWFIEKNKFGESKMYSLEEFKPRHDKDIRKGYKLGRFGAIPIISNIPYQK